LTYTFFVTNTGAEDVQATVNAKLPEQIAASGTFTWTPVIVAGGAWEQSLNTALAQNLTEPLPYEMQVTTDQGLSQAYADVLAPEFRASKQASGQSSEDRRARDLHPRRHQHGRLLPAGHHQ
jgi:hypothetical protein